MVINTRLIHIIVISFLVILTSTQENLSKEQEGDEAEETSQLIKGKLEDMEIQLQKMNQFQQALNEQANKILELQAATSNQMEKLKEIGKKIGVWSNIMKKLNEYVTKGNDVLIGFNDKVSSVMTKMVGFEEQMKAIASLDTLVVCILSLVLVKILKDEFMDEGYQPIGDSVRTPVSEISQSGFIGERQIAQ